MNYKKPFPNQVFSYCNKYCFGCFGDLWPFKRDPSSDLEIPILDTARTNKLYHTSQSVHEDEVDQADYQPPGWDCERSDLGKVIIWTIYIYYVFVFSELGKIWTPDIQYKTFDQDQMELYQIHV